MKKEKVCEGHLPSFFKGDSDYEIVPKEECKWCIHNKKLDKIKNI